jgi:hypothetical protein
MSSFYLLCLTWKLKRRSVWRSAWSCTGLFSRKTDPKPLRRGPLTRRQNSRQNSAIFKCRPFTCSAWTYLWKNIDLRGPVLGSSLEGLTCNLRLRPQTRRRNNQQNSDVLNVVLLLSLSDRAHGCVDLREDLRGPVLGSSLGGLTRNPSSATPRHGDGTAGRTATFLNVVLLFALPDHAGEYVICVNICVVLYWALLSEDWPETPPAPPPDTKTEQPVEQQRF